MNSFMVALGKELLEQRRSYRLLVIVLVLGLWGFLSPLTAKLTPEIFKLMPGGEEIALLIPEPTYTDAAVQYNKNHTQFGLILALLLTMGAVVQEKERKTAALVLTKPLSRRVFISAKFAALALAFTLGTVTAGIAAYYYTMLLFQAPPLSGWLLANLLLVVYLLVYISITLFFSTIARSVVAAGGFAFLAMILLGLVGSLPTFGDYMPGKIVEWGLTASIGAESTAWPALLVSIGIILVCLVASWIIFERQEI
jgi:ABC-2 type transport system permease protein